MWPYKSLKTYIGFSHSRHFFAYMVLLKNLMYILKALPQVKGDLWDLKSYSPHREIKKKRPSVHI